MFITRKLYDAIKELYFRNYQDTDLEPLPKDFTIEDIVKLQGVIRIVERRDGIDLTTGENSMDNLVADLKDSIRGTTVFNSKIGRDAEQVVTSMSNKVRGVLHKTKLSDVTQQVMAILMDNSWESCMVGGCVRDSLIGKTPKDIDFVTDISYDKMTELFKEEGFTIKETGKQFLVMIVAKDGEEFEIANFRKDGTYEDGRRPESVEIGTIFDDSERRDMTVNALYYNLNNRTIVDPTGQGIDDIRSMTLRFVGNPKARLDEDSLRAYRFYRFLSRGFNADPKSLRAVRGQFIEDNKKMKSLQEFYRMWKSDVNGILSDAFQPTVDLDVNFTDFERIRGEIEKMIGV